MTEKPPQKIKVHGREGFNAPRINGIYKLRAQKVGDTVSYIKCNNEENRMVIWFWGAKKVWMMTRLSMVNTESAYACVQDDVAFPTLVKKAWNVYDKTAGKHVSDKNLKIEPHIESTGKVETVKTLSEDQELLLNQITQMELSIEDYHDTRKQQGVKIEEVKSTITQVNEETESLRKRYEKLRKESQKTKKAGMQVAKRIKKLRTKTSKQEAEIGRLSCESSISLRKNPKFIAENVFPAISNLNENQLEILIQALQSSDLLCAKIVSEYEPS